MQATITIVPEKVLTDGFTPHLERADLILHAGDLIDPVLLNELAAYGPVRAVRGNLDPPEASLPETLEFKFGGVRSAMIYDSGPKSDRRNRMQHKFPRGPRRLRPLAHRVAER
jgi:predicted phosphodiesterase